MLQREWWCDTIVLVYGLRCFRRLPAPDEISHEAICWCPGDVTISLPCECLSHQVPGPRVSIPSLAGSVCIPASADQWPILGVSIAVIKKVRENAFRSTSRMINLCFLPCFITSSYQHGWKCKHSRYIQSIKGRPQGFPKKWDLPEKVWLSVHILPSRPKGSILLKTQVCLTKIGFYKKFILHPEIFTIGSNIY